MGQSTCPGCTMSFDPLQGKYAPDGRVVCAACGERLVTEQTARQKNNAGSAFVGACGAVLIALLSFVLQARGISFLMPLLALGFGGGTAYTALRNPDAKAALGWKRIPTVVLGGIAVALALLNLLGSLLLTATLL